MRWVKKDNYHIASGIFTICKIFIAGIPRYELWKRENGVAKCIATGELQQLKQQAKEIQNESM
jgi:hypothetical protein